MEQDYVSTAGQLSETDQDLAQGSAGLAMVHTVSQALAAGLDLDALLSLVGEQLRQVFQPDIAYLAVADPPSGLIRFPYSFGQGDKPLGLGEGLSGQVLASAQPLIVNERLAGQSRALGAVSPGEQVASYLGVPVMAGPAAIGVIGLGSKQPERRFTDYDQRLVGIIAAFVGAALQQARLSQETQRRVEELATLAEIGSDIAAIQELQPVLERIAAHAMKILRVRDIAIYLVEPDGQTLQAQVALGAYVDEIKSNSLRIGSGVTGSVAQSGVAELVNYMSMDPRSVHIVGTPHEEDEQESLMVAPLISRGQVIGVINVWRLHTAGLFTQPELDFLVSISRQAAIALESARLHLETQRRATEMAALAEVGRDISSTLDLPTVLERIAWHARALLHADTSAVYLPDSSGRNLQAIVAVGSMTEAIKADMIPLGEGIIGDLANRRAAEVINDVDHDPRARQIPGTPQETDEKLMAAPLLSGDHLAGMMAVWRSGQSAPFTQSDLDFLTGLARQAAIAIQNARLFAEVREARAAAEEANASKSAFLANVSHELRTPLASILGFARLVQKRLEERLFPLLSLQEGRTERTIAQVRENLQIIQIEGQRLATLINNVLDLEKIEAGQMVWEFKPVSVPEIIDQAAAATAALFEQKGLRLVLELSQDLPEVNGDHDRLVQVVINLLSNAVRFTPRGQVVCGARRAGQELLVSVIDPGIGIDPRDHALVFEKFKQVGDTLTGKPKGTGLGLAICKEIIAHHGGRIWLESQPGQGSTFSFSLPVLPLGH